MSSPSVSSSDPHPSTSTNITRPSERYSIPSPSLQIPFVNDWLFPGSPTPIRMSVRVSSEELANRQLPSTITSDPSLALTNTTRPCTPQVLEDLEPSSSNLFQQPVPSGSLQSATNSSLPSTLSGQSQSAVHVQSQLEELPVRWENLYIKFKEKRREEEERVNASDIYPSTHTPSIIIDYAHGSQPSFGPVDLGRERSSSPYDPSEPTMSSNNSSSSEEANSPTVLSQSNVFITNRMVTQSWVSPQTEKVNKQPIQIIDLATDDDNNVVMPTKPRVPGNNIVRVYDNKEHFKNTRKMPAIVNARWDHMRKMRGDEIPKAPNYRRDCLPSNVVKITERTEIRRSSVVFIPHNVQNTSGNISKQLKKNSTNQKTPGNYQQNFILAQKNLNKIHNIPQVKVPQPPQNQQGICTQDEITSSITCAPSSHINKKQGCSQIPVSVLRKQQVAKSSIISLEAKKDSATSLQQTKSAANEETKTKKSEEEIPKYLYSDLLVTAKANFGVNQAETITKPEDEGNQTSCIDQIVIKDVVSIPLPSEPPLVPDILFNDPAKPISSAESTSLPLSLEKVLNEKGTAKPGTVKLALQQYMERQRAEKASGLPTNPKSQQSVQKSQSFVLKHSLPTKIPASKKQDSVMKNVQNAKKSEQQPKETEQSIQVVPQFLNPLSVYQNTMTNFPQNTTYQYSATGFPQNYMYPTQQVTSPLQACSQSGNYAYQSHSQRKACSQSGNYAYQSHSQRNSTFVPPQSAAMQHQKIFLSPPNSQQGNSTFTATNSVSVQQPNSLYVPPKVTPLPSNSRDPRKKTLQAAEDDQKSQSKIISSDPMLQSATKNVWGLSNPQKFGHHSLAKGSELVLSQTKQNQTGVIMLSYAPSQLNSRIKKASKTNSLTSPNKSDPITLQASKTMSPLRLLSLHEYSTKRNQSSPQKDNKNPLLDSKQKEGTKDIASLTLKSSTEGLSDVPINTIDEKTKSQENDDKKPTNNSILSDKSVIEDDDMENVANNKKTSLSNLDISIENVVIQSANIFDGIEVEPEIIVKPVKKKTFNRNSMKKFIKKKKSCIESKPVKEQVTTVSFKKVKNVRSSNRLISDSSSDELDMSIDLEDPSCLFENAASQSEPLEDQMYNMLQNIDKQYHNSSKINSNNFDIYQSYILPKAFVVIDKLNMDNLSNNKKSLNTKSSRKSGEFDILEYFQRHSLHRLRCLLCETQHHKIAAHYIHSHSDSEVLCSRLSPADTKHAILESDIVQAPPNSNLCCRFCSFRTQNMFVFHDHVTGHTGEFRFQCGLCSFLASSSSGIFSHSQQDHQGETADVVLLKEVENSKMLPGFLCSECNYVQLSQARVEAHVKTHSKSPRVLKLNMASYIPDQELAEEPTYYMRTHQKQDVAKAGPSKELELPQKKKKKKKKSCASTDTNAPKRPRGQPLKRPSSTQLAEVSAKKARSEKKTLGDSTSVPKKRGRLVGSVKKIQSASPLDNSPKKSPGPAPVKETQDNVADTTPTTPQKSPTLNKSNKPALASVKKARLNSTSPQEETTSSPTIKKNINKPAPASAKKSRTETSKQSPPKKLSDRPAPACVKKALTDFSKSPEKSPPSNKKLNDRPAPASVKKARLSADPCSPQTSSNRKQDNPKKALFSKTHDKNGEDDDATKECKKDDVQCLVCNLWFYGQTVKRVWLQCVVCRKWLHSKCTKYKHHCNECYRIMCG